MQKKSTKERNSISMPKIINEEQIVIAAKDLSYTLKNSSLINLPDQNLYSKVDQLCDIFNAIAENIITKKLIPLEHESDATIRKLAVNKEDSTHPRVKEIDICLRVKSKASNNDTIHSSDT